MEEYEYSLECTFCETHIHMIVQDVDEKPIYCPMCGDDLSSKWVEHEEESE